MRYARLAVLSMLAFAVSMLEPSGGVVNATGPLGDCDRAVSRTRLSGGRDVGRCCVAIGRPRPDNHHAPAFRSAATLAEQDPPAVEAALDLGRPARRLIQQGLRNEGFDPGAPDGLFGPRTRTAIRDWQEARGDRATGYLDGAQAELLRDASSSTEAGAQAAASTSSPVAADATGQPPSTSAETVFWQSVMNSTNPEELEAYLLQFPNGVFRALAEVRLAALRDTERDQSTVVGQAASGEASVRGVGAEEGTTRSLGTADSLLTETAPPDRQGSTAASPPIVDAPVVAELSPATAVNCDDWNTEEFFQTANASAVAACLAAGGDVGAREGNGWTPLHRSAAYTDHPAVVEALLAAGAGLEAPLGDDNPATPLSLAVSNNENVEVLEALLAAGANRAWRASDGRTLLHLAAENNPNPAMIEALLAAGADVGPRDDNGLTPLHRAAAFTDHPAVVKALLAAGAGLEAVPLGDDNPTTPLSLAVSNNENVEVLEALLAAGANRALRASDGRTLLHLAAANNPNPAIIEAFLVAGADVGPRDDNGLTPLHWAAAYNPNPAIIEALLAAGADVGARDDNGRTPLHRAAASSDHPAVVETLLAAGAGLEAPLGEDRLDTPLSLAVRNNENVEVLETLLAAGANQTWRASDGQTPLHLAAANNPNPAIIEALLAAGTDVEARDDNGWTPLHFAAASTDHPAVVEALLAAGAGLEVRDDLGLTPLHHSAASSYNPAVVATLLAAGATLEAVAGEVFAGDDVFTPLSLAVSNNENVEVLETLLAAGANRAWRASDGRTLLHLAAQNNNNPAVVEALLAAGGGLEAPLGDDDPTTPLSLAVSNNQNVEVLETLLAAGANRAWRASDGRTLLHLAAANNRNPAIIEALLAADSSAGLDSLDDDGATPLSRAVDRSNWLAVRALLDAGANARALPEYVLVEVLASVIRPRADISLLEALLAAGADPTATRYSATPLHHASRAEEVASLVAAGADVMARASDGGTPLHWTEEKREVIAALVAAGADVMARNNRGRTPLHSVNFRAEAVDALLTAGADVMARDNRGATPLHFARSPEAVNALLRVEANVEARDERGRTPLHYAALDQRDPLEPAGRGRIETLVAADANLEARDDGGNTPLHLAAAHDIGSGMLRTHAGNAIESLLDAGANSTARNVAGKTPWDLAEANEALKGSDAYWRLNDARFSATPRPESRRPTPTGGPPQLGASASQRPQTRACEIPGYPTPADPPTLGLDWCESTIGFQRRVFALQAAGAWCAIAGGTSTSPDQVSARHQEINAACDALDALAQGAPSCRCPAGYRP